MGSAFALELLGGQRIQEGAESGEVVLSNDCSLDYRVWWHDTNNIA